MIDPWLAAARRGLMSLLDAHLDDRADRELEPLIRRVTTISDRELRRMKISRLIQDTSPRLGFLVMRWLWESRDDDDPTAREMLLDLVTTRPLIDSLGYERTRRLYTFAQREGPAEMGRLFLSKGVVAGPGHRRDSQAENEKMVSISLGLRKAYARGRDRFKLDRLRFDRNPAVIRNLLRNPRVVEGDVIRVAAQRPTNPACLVEVYRSTRWISRYPLKKALAFNPYTPLDIVVALMPHLLRQDLRDLSRSKVADEQIRLAAGEMLGSRERTGRRAGKSPSRVGGGGDGGERVEKGEGNERGG
jgi:hypothetical protein